MYHTDIAVLETLPLRGQNPGQHDNVHPSTGGIQSRPATASHPPAACLNERPAASPPPLVATAQRF
jgi:hypothetical protein